MQSLPSGLPLVQVGGGELVQLHLCTSFSKEARQGCSSARSDSLAVCPAHAACLPGVLSLPPTQPGRHVRQSWLWVCRAVFALTRFHFNFPALKAQSHFVSMISDECWKTFCHVNIFHLKSFARPFRGEKTL